MPINLIFEFGAAEKSNPAPIPNSGENMTESTVPQRGNGGVVSIPEGAVPLESVLCTEELHRRPARPPDHEKENRALVTLARALAESPRTILQVLADTILEVFEADSAGLSLLTTLDGGKRFYWPAIAGVWKPHVGGGTPRDFGPCGDVLDRNRTLLFQHFERRYSYLLPVMPEAEAAARELASGSEAKVRRLIDANIMGIFIWKLDGKIVEANEAFLSVVGYDRDDLTSGRLSWRELTPAEWRDADDRRVAELEAIGTAQPYEKE